MNSLTFLSKQGREIESVFEDLANLRITVFRDFPYLYEGHIDYERDYIQTYLESERSFLFAVYDKDKMVGASTCIPLLDETNEVKEPFIKGGFDLGSIFYFGESVLLSAYRGRGLGHRFFDEREAHAISFGTYQTACFCSVQRPDNHPARPANYRPNDIFWIKRGYKQQPNLQSSFEWLDVGDDKSTFKPMVYWMKSL